MKSGLQASLWDGVRLRSLFPILLAGAVLGFYEVFFAISLTSLIFSGPLLPYLSIGIGISLVATIVYIGIGTLSSVRGSWLGIQDSTTVILALIAGSLAATLVGDELLPTVLVALALATLLIGLFLLMLGGLKLGGLIRYIPYPVVGGFLAGTGWLLVQGTFSTLCGVPLSLGNLPELLQPANMVLWMPSVVFSLTLVICIRKFRSSIIVPALLVAGIVLFYLALVFTGTSILEARALGLLLGEDSSFSWHLLNLDMLRAADWSAILNQWPNFLVLMGITVMGLLLNLSAIEVEIRREYDINRELMTTGAALSVVGIMGGMIGYHDLGATRLARDMGALKRLSAILGGLVCLLILTFGTALLAFIPMPIVGGLLLFLGLDFLFEWVIIGWKRFSRLEYGIVLLILAVIVSTNFMVGVAVGLVAMLFIFVVSYSRTRVIKHEFSGADIQSNVGRSIDQRSKLAREGDQVYVLELQGFLFFGTSNALVEQIKKRVNDPRRKPLRYAILDFRLVTGIDSSAALSFCKCEQMAREKEFTLIFTNITPEVRRQLQSSGLSMDGELVRALKDLDHGLEWCEEQILPKAELGEGLLPSLCAQLELEGLKPELSVRLEGYLKPIVVQPGDYLIHQGGTSEDMYYIVDGQVSIHLESEKGERVRLRRLGRGTFVGELGLYLDIPRTASVIADLPTTAYQLTRQALDEIHQHDPDLAAAFHQMIARQVSERLVQTNRGISALQG